MSLNRGLPNIGKMSLRTKCGQLARQLIVVIVLLLLTACGLSREDLTTLVPDIEVDALDIGEEKPDGTPVVDESPRTAVEIEVPPTWTPGAVVNSPVQSQAEAISTADTSTGATAEITSESVTYEVQPGDTLAEIAIQFNVALDDIAALNGIENLDHIEVGQILTIPG